MEYCDRKRSVLKHKHTELDLRFMLIDVIFLLLNILGLVPKPSRKMAQTPETDSE